MPTTAQIAALVEARTASLKHALETKDIDTILSWHAPESTFTDPLRGVTSLPRSELAAFYAVPFANFSAQTLTSSKSTAPTPEFQAWEIVGECVSEVDDPLGSGVRKGQKMVANLVSLIWWEWKGEGVWEGDCGEKEVRGWKIARQVDYCVPRRGDGE